MEEFKKYVSVENDGISNKVVELNSINDIENRPIPLVGVTLLPENGISLALKGYDGSIHQIESKDGVVSGGLLTFASGEKTDLDYMIGRPLEEFLGNSLAHKISSMKESGIIESPVLDKGAGMWDYYSEGLSIALNDELCEKLNPLLVNRSDKLFFDNPVETFLLGKDLGNRAVVALSRSDNGIMLHTLEGDVVSLDQIIISGSVALHKLVDNNSYHIDNNVEQQQERVSSELREARGYLMDVISHALSQMNGHVEIEHTVLPSVPMKGDFWKEEGGNVFMELIKADHNIKDAMFHDVHAEKYTLDEVINNLDCSETYALTIAVREAQIKDIVSSFDGQEIYFDEPVAVSRDDDDIEKDYVAGVKIDDDGSLNISGHRVDDDGETHVFYHADDLYLNGYDDLLAKLSEMRQQENVKEEHFLEPLTDEQWKVMSEIGYPYAPGNAKEHEAASIPDMIYWRLAAGMMTKDDAVRAFSTTGYTIGRNPECTNEILASLNIMYKKLDNDFKPLTATDKQENVNDEFLKHVVYKDRCYAIFQNMEISLNAFMKENGVDIPLSHVLYGENVKSERWSDLHQVASRAVESILRESGQGDEKLLNSATTDYVSDKAKTLAFGLIREIHDSEERFAECKKEALKAIGYPYFERSKDGGMNVPTVDVSLYWQYAAGVISLKDAAREFNRSGWTNFVDEKYTKAKFAQLNEQFGKLDADLKPLLAQQKELGEAKENLMNTLYSARTDLGDTILIKPTPVKLAGNAFAKASGVFLAPDGKGGGEFRLAGEYYAVLAVESDGHTEFDVTKILDNASSVNALTKAVHDAHVINLEQKSKQAIRDRIVTPSAHSFTPNQVDALNRYQQIATPETPAKEVFSRLLHEVSQEPDVAQKSEKWIIDTAKELDEVAKGNTREDNQQLKR